MAYSDYGGFAYRNGVRVEERSDFTVTPEGGYGTPGSYPGFALMAAGADRATIDREIMRPNGHAVIGDAPLFVTLYKQSYVTPYRIANGEVELAGEPVYADWEAPLPQTVELEIDGAKLSVTFEETDNLYSYAKLVQPDGTVWTAFSGYGVGAGLEDADYGYSTSACVARLSEVYP